jgi:hypothetical protein
MLNFGRTKWHDDDYGRIAPGTHGQLTVIGNIYENPELLRESVHN